MRKRASDRLLRKPEHALPEISNREIAQRAYEIYEARGGSSGSELDDWTEAERQLREERKARSDKAA